MLIDAKIADAFRHAVPKLDGRPKQRGFHADTVDGARLGSRYLISAYLHKTRRYSVEVQYQKVEKNQSGEGFLCGALGFNTDSFRNLPMILLECDRDLSRTKGRGEIEEMKNLIWKLRILKDTRGQDLIEYALMAGFVAVAAGAIMPGVASSISTIFSKIASVMSNASTQGS
jgi:pilus assembly protein Flp/PilA